MSDIVWQAPLWRWGLLVVPVVAVALWMAGRGRRGVRAYVDPALMGGALVTPRRPGRVVAALLALVALSAAIVAMARPSTTVTDDAERGTVMLAMDISDSMQKTDIAPTRLAVAQDAARRFIESAPDDVRIGLVSFADTADVIAAPTTDRAALLRSLQQNFSTTRRGTVIGDAIAASLGSLQASGALTTLPATPRDAAGRILLITDGAQLGGSVQPGDGAQRAAAVRVPVYTIMIGNDPGFPGQASPPETLAAVAATTGGVFAQTASAEDLRAVFADMGRIVAPEPRVEEHTWIPLAVSLLALIAALVCLVAIPARAPRTAVSAARP